MILDSALLSKAEGFIYDLCLFDDHLKVGSKIKVFCTLDELNKKKKGEIIKRNYRKSGDQMNVSFVDS